MNGPPLPSREGLAQARHARAEALAASIAGGRWTLIWRLDGDRLWQRQYRSLVDGRVTRSVSLRGTKRKITYAFGDSAVDVPVMPGGKIVEEADARRAANLDDLAWIIVQHDDALAAERAWEAADPIRARATA